MINQIKFNEIFYNSNIGMAICDLNGKFTDVNNMMCQIVGYSKEELLNFTYKEITHPDDLKKDSENLKQLIAGVKNNYRLEKRYVCKNGNLAHVIINVSLIKYEGKQLFFLAQIQDITKLTETVNEFEEINKKLEDFVYVASHDLQEPLRKIIAFGSMMQEELNKINIEKNNLIWDYLKRIINASERMQKLVNDILDYSRVISNDMCIFSEINLNEIIDDILSDYELTIKENNIKFEIEKFENFFADSIAVRQLFQNLISNAIKFRKADKQSIIKIYHKIEKQEIHFFVEDNGIGFDEKYLNKIFMPFQRLHNKKNYPGTGIGLSICKKIIENHKGKIFAKSVVGEGTIFEIIFPRKD